jgi:hypothetical protein
MKAAACPGKVENIPLPNVYSIDSLQNRLSKKLKFLLEKSKE